MPFESHPIFTPPADTNARIWRYGDLAKFLSVLDRSALFFSCLDTLDDVFEGLYTKSMVDKPLLNANDPSPEQMAHWQQVLRSTSRSQREVTSVSSWHCQEHESAAMWAQYLRSLEGIAIQSTYERLVKALETYSDFAVLIGLVQYIDYTNDVIRVDNSLAPVMTKRRNFEHERELRAVIWTVQHGKNSLGTDNKYINSRRLYVPIDLSTLIERVYIAPTAPSWIGELVASTIKRFGYNFPVHQSELAESPFY